MDIDLDALVEKARAATPPEGMLWVVGGRWWYSVAAVALQEALDPATVTALVERVKAAEAERDELRAHLKTPPRWERA